MKSENFNFIVHSLDDKALYAEICKKIKDTNAMSFKLMGLVPLLSVVCMMILCFFAEKLPPSLLVLTCLYGSLVTYFIFRWEKRNMFISDIFKSYAEILETRKTQFEIENQQLDMTLAGPYSLLRSKDESRLLTSLKPLKGWGKKEAETAMYGITIMCWLLLPFLYLLI